MDIQGLIVYVQHNYVSFLAGAIVTRPVLVADIAFKAVMRTPFRHIVLMNEPKISEWIDTFQAEFKKNIEAEKKTDSPAEPPKP